VSLRLSGCGKIIHLYDTTIQYTMISIISMKASVEFFWLIWKCGRELSDFASGGFRVVARARRGYIVDFQFSLGQNAVDMIILSDILNK